MCESTKCTQPFPHIYTYHPPRAILSVWKFGLHSWNPTKHCHLLIVIISLACSLTKKKNPCNTNTSHLYGNAPQYSPQLWCIDLCYHYDNSHSHLTPHYTIEAARGWIETNSCITFYYTVEWNVDTQNLNSLKLCKHCGVGLMTIKH